MVFLCKRKSNSCTVPVVPCFWLIGLWSAIVRPVMLLPKLISVIRVIKCFKPLKIKFITLSVLFVKRRPLLRPLNTCFSTLRPILSSKRLSTNGFLRATWLSRGRTMRKERQNFGWKTIWETGAWLGTWNGGFRCLCKDWQARCFTCGSTLQSVTFQ